MGNRLTKSNQPNVNTETYKNTSTDECNDSAEINDMAASVNASRSSEETSAIVINEIHSQHTHDPTDAKDYLQNDNSQPSTSRHFSFYRDIDNEAGASYDMLDRKIDRHEEDCISEISDQSFKTAVSEMYIDVEIEDSYFQSDQMNEDHTPSVNESTRVPYFSDNLDQPLSRKPQIHEERSSTNYVPDSRLLSQEDLGETSTSNNFDLLEIHDSENRFPTNEFRHISEVVNAGEILRNTQEENLQNLSCTPKIENTTCILSDEIASSTHEKNEIMTRNISAKLFQTKETRCDDFCFHIDEVSKAIQKALENINTAKAILSSANHEITNKSVDFPVGSNMAKVISNRENSKEKLKSKVSFQAIPVLKDTCLKEDSEPKTAYFSGDSVLNAIQLALNELRKKSECSLNGSPLHDVGVGKEESKGDRNHNINECSQKLQTLDSNVSQARVVPVEIEPRRSTEKRKISSSQDQTDEAAFLKRQKVPEAKTVSKNKLERTIFTRSETALKALSSTTVKSNDSKRQEKAPKNKLKRTIFTRSETALQALNSTTVKLNDSKRQKTRDGKIVIKSQSRVFTKSDNDFSPQGTLNSISTKPNEFASIKDSLRRAFSPQPSNDMTDKKFLNSTTAKPNKQLKIHETPDGKTVAKNRSCSGVYTNTDNEVSPQGCINSNLSKSNDFATIKDNLRRAFNAQPTTSFVLNNEMRDMAITGDTSSNRWSFASPQLPEGQSVQTLHGRAISGVATGTNDKDPSQQITTRGIKISGDHVSETEVEVSEEGDQ